MSRAGPAGPDDGAAGGADPPASPDASPAPEEGPGGPFPSWGALYTTVIVWMAGMILLLWLFTVTLRVEVGG